MTLESFVRHLAAATTPAVAEVGPGPRDFGAAGAGRLGELGRILSAHWVAALAGRADEVAAQGERLSAAVAEVNTAAGRYAEAERWAVSAVDCRAGAGVDRRESWFHV